MSEEPTALRLADALDMHWIEHSRCHPNDSPMCEAAAAELRRLHDELKECQDQRRAAFRRIEELDRELDAMRAQQPLTDEQIEAIYTQETGSLIDDSPWALVDFARAIEAAHGIK